MSSLLTAIKSNIVFIGECLLIFALLFVLAKLFERFAAKSVNKVSGSRRVAYIAMFSALAGVLMLLEIPLFFAPGFYKMDLSEIPVLISTLYLGPVAGVVTEFIKVIVKLMLKGTTTAFVGDFANFCVGCAMVLPASMIYHLNKTKKNAVLGLVTGTLVMTVFGSLFNAFYLLPKFSEIYGIPLEAIIGMGTAVNPGITSVGTLVLFAVVPFNLLKGLVVSVLTFLLYKRVEKVIFKSDKSAIAAAKSKSGSEA